MSSYFCLMLLGVMAISSCGNHTNAGTAGKARDLQDTAQHTLVLSGIFDSSGNKLLRIENPVLYKRSISKSVQQENARYLVLVKYENGDSTVQAFNALVAGDREGAKTQHGFFECELPVTRKIETIMILERVSKKILKEFSRKDIETRN